MRAGMLLTLRLSFHTGAFTAGRLVIAFRVTYLSYLEKSPDGNMGLVRSRRQLLHQVKGKGKKPRRHPVATLCSHSCAQCIGV